MRMLMILRKECISKVVELNGRPRILTGSNTIDCNWIRNESSTFLKEDKCTTNIYEEMKIKGEPGDAHTVRSITTTRVPSSSSSSPLAWTWLIACQRAETVW